MSQPEGSSPPFSLIKYEAEIQISANVEEYQKSQESQKQLDARPSPEDVLNNMILPRDWHTDNNQHFMQYVSHHKAERDDIIRLKEALDQALEHRQARTEGICPIREELFSQSFDEIVRQVTINSPERGLLLMRVRDQHKMTLAAYQTLYQSSVTFGMRKLLEAEQGMDELELLLAEAQQIKDTLENKKSELLSKKESLEKSILERKKEESEIREDQNLQIQEQEGFLAKFLAGIKEGTKQE